MSSGPPPVDHDITPLDPFDCTSASLFNATAVLVNASSTWIREGITTSVHWVETNFPSTDRFSPLFSLLSSSLASLVSYLSEAGFSDFQLRLIQEFGLILLGNCVLVLIAWKIYGNRISEKFLKSGGSRRVIEELRLSMSELKLPKEHDYKYK